ncbi:MAG: aspartate-semialdehyde dehydrogenase [Methanomassiliicoccales archaeon]
MNELKVAVLGASGMVGQRFCEMLSSHPYFTVGGLYASEKSGGRKLRDALLLPEPRIDDELAEMEMQPLNVAEIVNEQYDAIFSALPTSIAGPVEEELRSAGGAVFTNASPHRMEKDVPLVVPEVNCEHLLNVHRPGFIVANGNCSAIGLALTLKPLLPLGLKHVEVTTLQALSGAGYPGVASLDAVGNVIPHIQSEEEKLAAEIPKMLGAFMGDSYTPHPVSVDATCTRVPVRDGHLESVCVEVEKGTDLEEVRSLFSSFRSQPQELGLPSAPSKPVIVAEGMNRPQPLLDVYNGTPERARGMAATVGRIRVSGRLIRYVALTHNTIRGAAGGSVLNAEFMFRRGFL